MRSESFLRQVQYKCCRGSSQGTSFRGRRRRSFTGLASVGQDGSLTTHTLWERRGMLSQDEKFMLPIMRNFIGMGIDCSLGFNI